MSKLIILVTLVVGWTIFMLYQWSRHKKRMKFLEWEARRRRWQLDEHDRRWYRMESEVPTEWIRRSATVPAEGYMPSAMFKTDKLSPNKKIKSHKLVERKYTMRSPGVYTREVDLSVWVPVNNENDLDEL